MFLWRGELVKGFCNKLECVSNIIISKENKSFFYEVCWFLCGHDLLLCTDNISLKTLLALLKHQLNSCASQWWKIQEWNNKLLKIHILYNIITSSQWFYITCNFTFCTLFSRQGELINSNLCSKHVMNREAFQWSSLCVVVHTLVGGYEVWTC